MLLQHYDKIKWKRLKVGKSDGMKVTVLFFHITLDVCEATQMHT